MSMASSLENQFEHWRLRAQQSAAGQFMRWWGSELRQLLPADMRARMLHASRKVALRIGDGDLEVSSLEGTEMQVLDVFRLDQDPRLQHQQIRDLLIERELYEMPRVILLPEAVLLRKEVILPIATESNLRHALGFEMDRQTPFSAQDVYFDYRVVLRDRENEQLRVELIVCPKATLDVFLGLLSPRGVAPAAADVEEDGRPAGLNLLPLDLRHRVSNRRARFNLLLGLVAVAMLALVMAQSLWLREHQLEQLNEAIDEVRVEARRVQAIRTQIEDASEAAGFMLKRRSESMPTVKVLTEVTRILPDDTYLDRFRVWEGAIQLQGKSGNAQRLIEIVNESELFSGASFRGPTRLDTRSGREIFDLNSDLSPGN